SILAAHIKDQEAKPVSSVIGFGFKTTPVNAAYVNGSSMHVLDYEPMWSPANHALSTNLPAVLALVETTDVNGKEAMMALIKGIELQGWIRHASRQNDPAVLKLHPPGVTGPLSSAVAAGHILGLDAETLRHAIGISVSRTGSVLANVGTMVKMTHCGMGTAMGLDAALLAQRGFTANPDSIETPRGFVDLYFKDEFHGEEMLAFGPPFRVVEPSYALKMFPSQYATHYAITAGITLHKEIGDPSKIKEINFTCPDMAYIDRPNPVNGLAGKFSWQYAVSSSLLDGKSDMATFEDERRFAPDMEATLKKVNLNMTGDIPGDFLATYVELEVVMEDGARHQTRCNGPRGSWNGEPVSLEEHLIKVRSCLDTRLNEADRERIIDLASHFEELENKDMREIMAIASKPNS
ncbi:MAG: MmgE/PrpD family protein, partial [Proteobacteria bacterium]|nr:MmgE/PrpD family protein [Pseudomonadota bacterium]